MLKAMYDLPLPTKLMVMGGLWVVFVGLVLWAWRIFAKHARRVDEEFAAAVRQKITDEERAGRPV